jgi:agmatine deiminase
VGELRAVVATIAECEPVRLLTPTDQLDEVKQQSFGSNVEIIEAPVSDIWMRDIAPTFALRDKNIVAVNWNFNSWGATSERLARSGVKLATEAAAIFGGVRVSAPFVAEGGAFVTDGTGTIITTRSCLLNKNRNPNGFASQIERNLAEFGGRHVIWLDGNSKEPITSGHIDGYVMFGESGEVLVEDVGGVDRASDNIRMRDIETLRFSINAEGRPLCVRIVAPPREKFWASKSALFAPAYLNAYVANGAVITGRFGDLAVSFQEVVHSALTGNSEVAKPPAIRGEPNGHPQECPPNAQRSRGDGSCRSERRGIEGRRRPPVQYDTEDGGQMGRTLPRGRCRRIA